MRLDTIKKLKTLFDAGNKCKSKRISGEGAHAKVMEDVAADDWHEQLIVTVARVKAFFGYSKDKYEKLIVLATLVEAPSGAPTEETSEDIEEAELDDSRDQMEAEEPEELDESWEQIETEEPEELGSILNKES
jgi:hypothetical protein